MLWLFQESVRNPKREMTVESHPSKTKGGARRKLAVRRYGVHTDHPVLERAFALIEVHLAFRRWVYWTFTVMRIQG